MAKQVVPISDPVLAQLFHELFNNLTPENFAGKKIPLVLNSPNGTAFEIIVDDNGNLGTKRRDKP